MIHNSARDRRRSIGRVAAASVALVAVLTGCSPTGPITPVVTYAGLDPALPGYMQATGSVSGVSESGGTCIFTLWADSGAATRLTGTGEAAGLRTSCGPVEEPLGFLVGGSYEVELTYEALSGETVKGARIAIVLPVPTNLNP